MFTSTLIIVAAVITGISCEISIEPDEEEFQISTGVNFILKCSGDEEVRWAYPSDPSEDKTSTKTVNYANENGHFVAYLRIEGAHYMDTGFYHCLSVKNDSEEVNLYLYVKDARHLLAIAETENLIHLMHQQYKELIIPCRPTSPDVNVTLWREDELVDFPYDSKKGFTIENPMMSDSGSYTCEAKRGPSNQKVNFYVLILPESEAVPKPEIVVQGQEGAHTIVGDTISMTCTVTVNTGVQITLDWNIPDNVNKKKVDFYELTTVPVVGYEGVEMKLSTKRLEIRNVTTEEQGLYTCIVTDHSNNTSEERYHLEVFPVDLKYLNVSMEGKTEILVRNGEREAQWIVHIEAYPVASIKWVGPENISLHHSDKYTVSNYQKKTKITVHDITIEDSGIYTLYASNSVKNETLDVTLLVEDRPNVLFKPKSKVYYDINKEEDIHCEITAYPKPNITWNFVECTDHKTFCATGHTLPAVSLEPQPLKNKSHVKWLSTVSKYARESGIITCRAENHLGFSEDHLEFKVTDVDKGFEIRGPKHRVLATDDIVIECGASIYEYYPDIDWIFESLEDKKFESLKNSTRKGISISTNKTSFSYQSYLYINEVNQQHSGTYKCRVKSFLNEKYREREFKLLVQSKKAPSFTNFTNLDGKMITLNVGRPITWNCSVVGLPEPEVLWEKDNKPLEIKDKRIKFENKNHTLHIEFTEYEDAGRYRCRATNSAGTISTYSDLRLKGPAMASKALWWIFIVLIVFIIILVAATLGFCFKYKKEQKKRKDLISVGLEYFSDGKVDLIDPNMDIGEQAELLPYDKKWEFPREKLKLGKQLGSGAFGVVVKGEATGLYEDDVPVTVAVKMVKQQSDVSHIKALATELKIMAHLGQHLNVVNLLGACTGNIHKRELFVMVEYCKFGNLHKYLQHHRNSFIDQIDPVSGSVDFSDKKQPTELTYIKSNHYHTNTGMGSEYSNGQSVQTDMTSLSTPLDEDGYLKNRDEEILANYQGDYKINAVRPISTQDLFCWGYQVAKGMEYLASRKVLHGDLAARNVLLAEGNVVKISDFGLAKKLYSQENYKNKKRDVPLPVKWMSIEAIRDGIFSTQSDIWSFGILLWEMFSLAYTPYPGLYGEEFFNKLLHGYRMDKPKHATEDVYNLMMECWKEQPMLRPSFTECAERLGSMLGESVKDYYLELNGPYMEYNSHLANENDPFNKLMAPSYENWSKSGMPDEGYVCMKPPKTDALNEMELTPMITPGCNSFLNPGYQDTKKFMDHNYSNQSQFSRVEAV